MQAFICLLLFAREEINVKNRIIFLAKEKDEKDLVNFCGELAWWKGVFCSAVPYSSEQAFAYPLNIGCLQGIERMLW